MSTIAIIDYCSDYIVIRYNPKSKEFLDSNGIEIEDLSKYYMDVLGLLPGWNAGIIRMNGLKKIPTINTFINKLNEQKTINRRFLSDSKHLREFSLEDHAFQEEGKYFGYCHIHGCKEQRFPDQKIRFCRKCQEVNQIELDSTDFQAFWRFYEDNSIGWFDLYHVKNSYFYPKKDSLSNLLRFQLLGQILRDNVGFDEDRIIKKISEHFNITFKWES